MTTGTEVPADSHSVYWTAMSSAGLKRPVRNAHHLRLWFCADYVRRLSGCLRAFFHPVETSTPPQWWRWRESNPRPECRPVAGITTMYGIMGAQALIYKSHAPTRPTHRSPSFSETAHSRSWCGSWGECCSRLRQAMTAGAAAVMMMIRRSIKGQITGWFHSARLTARWAVSRR
jgi:hypothetical protein